MRYYIEKPIKSVHDKILEKNSEVYDIDTLVVKVWPLNFYYEHYFLI